MSWVKVMKRKWKWGKEHEQPDEREKNFKNEE